MRCCKIFLLFSLCPVLLFSQQKEELSKFKKQIKLTTDTFENEVSFKKASTFFLQKEWDSTIVYTAKQLSIPNQEKELKEYCYFLRGYSFKNKKLFSKAEEEFLKVSKDFIFHSKLKILKGEIALEQKKYQEALNSFKTINVDSLPDYLSDEYFNILENIGVAYLHLENFDEAIKYLSKSIKEQERKKDTAFLIGSYSNIASLYYVAFLDSLAIPYYEKSYKLSKLVEDFKLKRVTALNMSIVEENRNDFKKALVYRKEHEQWKDSLNNQNKIYETAQLEKKIAVAQKQKEVTVLEAENKTKATQRNGLMVSAGILLLLLGVTFYFYREKIKTNTIISEQKERLDALNTTKDKLFSIVSHDLRSSVNAIKTSNKSLLNNLETDSRTHVKETLQQNSAIVNGAYGLLDNLLNWALLQTKQSYFKRTSLQLFKIVEHVAYNYQPLMNEKKMTFENRVDKTYAIKADQESLKVILRNLIDNAIKFSKSGDSIKVYSKEQDAYYDLIVEDSGIGMDEDTKEELLKYTQLLSKKKHEDIVGTGLGLHLVKSMVVKNQGKFNIESELGKGTKIIISLPKNS